MPVSVGARSVGGGFQSGGGGSGGEQGGSGGGSLGFGGSLFGAGGSGNAAFVPLPKLSTVSPSGAWTVLGVHTAALAMLLLL